MNDPESREPTFQTLPESGLFAWQIEYPVGSIFVISAPTMQAALISLKGTLGCEPFMIRRAGTFVEISG